MVCHGPTGELLGDDVGCCLEFAGLALFVPAVDGLGGQQDQDDAHHHHGNLHEHPVLPGNGPAA